MKNLIKRILTSIIWPPLIFIIVYVFKVLHNLPFTLFMFGVAIIGSYEMKRLIYNKEGKPLLPFYVPSLLVIATYLENTFLDGIKCVQFTLITMFAISFFLEVLNGANTEKPFSDSINNIAKTVLLIIYPSYLSTFPVNLVNVNSNGPFYILMLFALVFTNDIACYLFGMLLGGSSRGVFKVSPNKSVVGFVAGFIFTQLATFLFIKFSPSLSGFSIKSSLILGTIVALTSDIGDLIESTFKRSADVKDSGTFIMGRGGVLDSLDSFLNSAPFFCLIMSSWTVGLFENIQNIS